MTCRKTLSIAGLALLASVGSGCYRWVQVDLPAAAVSPSARAEATARMHWVATVLDGERIASGPSVTDSRVPSRGRPIVAEALGRARVTRMNDLRFELDDAILDETGVRGRSRGDGARTMVTVPLSDIRLLEARKLDKAATFLVAGGIAAAGVAVIVLGTGDDGDGGGYEPPE